MAENTTTEVVENEESKELSGWEISDYVDSWAAQSGFKAYVYSYKQGSRQVVGLTARAYEHLALDPRRPITILEETEEQVTLNGVEGILTKVKVAMDVRVPLVEEVNVSDTVTEIPTEIKTIIRVGKNFSPLVAYGKPDEFVFQKSSTKALRNGIAKLIPATEQEKAKTELLSLQGGKPVEVPQAAIPAQTQTRSQSQSKTNTKVETGDTRVDVARKTCFGKLSEIQKVLFENIPEADFWKAVTAHYDVDSRKQFTESHWKQLTKIFATCAEKKTLTGLVATIIKNYKASQENSDLSE